MVGVCNRLGRDGPCFFPSESVFIEQNTHKLGNRKSRVCIVHLERNLLIQFMNVIMLAHILVNSFLYTCRYEEILLF